VVDVGGVAVAPRGDRAVAFITRVADIECNCYHQHLELLDQATGDRQTIADLGQPFLSRLPNGTIIGALMSAQPLWSRDGRKLAYLLNSDGQAALHVYNLETRETQTVDTQGEEPFTFAWGEAAEDILFETAHPSEDAERAIKTGYANGFL